MARSKRTRRSVVSRWRSETTDVLTTVIDLLRVRGSAFCRSELRAPWTLRLQQRGEVHFHVVERGPVWLRVDGARRALALEPGDLALVTTSGVHWLSNAEQVPLQPVIDMADKPSGTHHLTNTGHGVESRMICGGFRLERREAHPLIGLLPPVIHLQSVHGRMPNWLAATIQSLSAETREPRAGTETIVARLNDVILVQVLRAWTQTLGDGEGGWLGALRDDHLGQALALIHRYPEKRWTVADLAAATGLSRSPFAARFTTLVGEPPMAYLTRWRMQMASTLLEDQTVPLGDVAERVGYESLPAFSKAFKRHFGISPSRRRRPHPRARS